MDNHGADNGTARTEPSSKVVSSTGASYKPHLLVYAHYYYPDTASTGQIIQDVAEGMLDTFCVTVICVVPSYLGRIEDKWKTQKYYVENFKGVDVVRVAVPEFTKSSKKSRVKNILAYFFRAMKATGSQPYHSSLRLGNGQLHEAEMLHGEGHKSSRFTNFTQENQVTP